MDAEEGKIHREQEAAAEVDLGPAAGGDAVPVVRGSDAAHYRRVDDQRTGETDVRNDRQHHAECPAGAADKTECTAGGRSYQRERGQKPQRAA